MPRRCKLRKVSAAATVASQDASAEQKEEDVGGPRGGCGAEDIVPKSRFQKRKLRRKGPAVEEPSSESSSSEDEDADEEDGEEAGDLDIDFEFFDPNEEDYHSVGDLVRNGTWEFVDDLNFAELTDSIVGQGNIGTLIKSESDAGTAETKKEDTVCCMLTALNFRQFEKVSWPKSISGALIAKATKHGSADIVSKLTGFLQGNQVDHQIGLILSERFVNLPLELVPALHRALQEDIEWSCTTPECPPDEQPFYKFTHFVGVIRCFQASPSAALNRGKKRTATANVLTESPGFGGLVYPRPEDEVYLQKASFHFTFAVSASTSDRSPAPKGPSIRGQEMRAVFGITKKSFEQVVKTLSSSPAFRVDDTAA